MGGSSGFPPPARYTSRVWLCGRTGPEPGCACSRELWHLEDEPGDWKRRTPFFRRRHRSCGGRPYRYRQGSERGEAVVQPSSVCARRLEILFPASMGACIGSKRVYDPPGHGKGRRQRSVRARSVREDITLHLAGSRSHSCLGLSSLSRREVLSLHRSDNG